MSSLNTTWRVALLCHVRGPYVVTLLNNAFICKGYVTKLDVENIKIHVLQWDWDMCSQNNRNH